MDAADVVGHPPDDRVGTDAGRARDGADVRAPDAFLAVLRIVPGALSRARGSGSLARPGAAREADRRARRGGCARGVARLPGDLRVHGEQGDGRRSRRRRGAVLQR